MKKIILFFVEGYHDRIEIQSILNMPLFDDFRKKYRVEYIESIGDITSDYRHTVDNIVSIIELEIKRWIKNTNGIVRSDIAMVIQLIDTDGAFVPESQVVFGDTLDPIYENSRIVTNNVNSICKRNASKSKKIRRLLIKKNLYNIPFELFFVSCNMEHVMYDKPNATKGDKHKYQTYFVYDCAHDDDFLYTNFLSDNCKSTSTYNESWDWIQEGTNSLSRHTNFNLFLEENMRSN